MIAKKILTGTLAGVVLFTSIYVNPMTGKANSDLPAVKTPSVQGYRTGDAVGVKFSWEKVPGAGGYQYRYNLFWTKDSKAKDFTKKNTKKTSVKIDFQDYGTIKFQIRPYMILPDGTKQFNTENKGWTTCTLASIPFSE